MANNSLAIVNDNLVLLFLVKNVLMSLVVDFIITIIYIVESSGSKKLVGKTKLNRLDIVTLCRLPAAGQ